MSMQVHNSGVSLVPLIEVQNSQSGILYDVISGIYEGATSNFVRDLGRKVVWAWEATFEVLKSEWMMISLIFFGIFATFGFTSSIQATVVYALARFVTITWQDRGAQDSVDRLTGENLALRLRVEELNQQRELDQVRLENVQRNGNLAEEEVDRVRNVRDEIIVQRAPLIEERNQLAEENETLRAANEQLTQHQQTARRLMMRLIQVTNKAVKDKEAQVGELERAFAELADLRNQNEAAPAIGEFNRLLRQAQELYQQSAAELAARGMQDYDFGIQNLVPLYKRAREARNQNLSEMIQTLDANSKERIQLERILAISQSEVDHLTQICQLLHLHTEAAIRMRTGGILQQPLVQSQAAVQEV